MKVLEKAPELYYKRSDEQNFKREEEIMRKLKIRFLDQLGEIRRIIQLSDRLLIVYTTVGVFYVKNTYRGYEAFSTEKVFENLKKRVKEG